MRVFNTLLQYIQCLIFFFLGLLYLAEQELLQNFFLLSLDIKTLEQKIKDLGKLLVIVAVFKTCQLSTVRPCCTSKASCVIFGSNSLANGALPGI